MRRLLLALALASLWADHASAQGPRPEDVSVSMLAGGVVSLATEADVAAAPFVRVDVALPISSWRMTPRLHVQVDLSALPGEAVTLEDAQTFRAVEFRMALCQGVATSLYVDLCAEGGFASRLPADPAPRDKAVRWGAGLVRFGRAGRGWLAAGVARDQRLDGLYRWTAVVGGALRLYEDHDGATKGASVQLVGDAILGLSPAGGPAARDVIRVGMAIGR